MEEYIPCVHQSERSKSDGISIRKSRLQSKENTRVKMGHQNKRGSPRSPSNPKCVWNFKKKV